MLKLHAFLNRKPSSLLPPPCQVEAVVELDAVSFENLLQRPMDDQPQITAHKSLMRCEEGVEHCVLFLGEGSQDGVLVNSEGYDWARYAAFIPGARMIANSHLEQQPTEFGDPGVARSRCVSGSPDSGCRLYPCRRSRRLDRPGQSTVCPSSGCACSLHQTGSLWCRGGADWDRA